MDAVRIEVEVTSPSGVDRADGEPWRLLQGKAGRNALEVLR